jgi:hypothetical protein
VAAKKSFTGDIAASPAMQFISNAGEEPGEGAKARRGGAPEGYKPNPLYIETRSKRVQLLFQPSLHSKLREAAAGKGVSVNELVHSILEEAVPGA